MNMKTLPPEIREKIFREAIEQKIKDKKTMGWDKIQKYITCPECEKPKKGIFIEDDNEFIDVTTSPLDGFSNLIRPSKIYIISCKYCGVNFN